MAFLEYPVMKRIFKLRLAFRGRLGQLPAVHAGHDDVRQQQADALVLFDEAQGLFPVFGLQHVVPERTERIGNVGAHVIVILDNQHAFSGKAARRLRRFRVGEGSRAHEARQSRP